MPQGYFPREDRLDRFIRRTEVDKESGCWLWTGPTLPGDYPRTKLSDNGVSCSVMVHRWMYEAQIGPIPEGLVVHHKCEKRLCINPAHLEAITTQENILRGNSLAARNARKTHCVRGHAYDEKNTHINRKGSRMCRRCAAEKMAERRGRERVARNA